MCSKSPTLKSEGRGHKAEVGLPLRALAIYAVGLLIGLGSAPSQAEPEGGNQKSEGGSQSSDLGHRPSGLALNATVQDGEIIGREQHRRVFMNVAGRRLMLVVPQDFRAEIANPEKVVLVNRDYSCVLTFRIAIPGSGAPAAFNPDLCRAWLATRLGGLKIQDEFTLTAANQSGPAFELCYKADGLARSSQVTFIPSPVGILEFSLAASPEKFKAAKAEFHGLLLRFRISDPNGRLEILSVQAET